MDVVKAILERRSVRSYSDKKVKLETVAKILDVARFSPSPGNVQNWKVVMVGNEAVKEELVKACVNQRWMMQAPLFLVICNETSDCVRLYKNRGKFYATQACAAYIQNIMLLAHERGLATCWVGAFNPETVCDILKIPQSVSPEAVIAIGYANEKEISVPPRRGLRGMVYFEKFGVAEKDQSLFPLEKHKEDKGTPAMGIFDFIKEKLGRGP